MTILQNLTQFHSQDKVRAGLSFGSGAKYVVSGAQT